MSVYNNLTTNNIKFYRFKNYNKGLTDLIQIVRLVIVYVA